MKKIVLIVILLLIAVVGIVLLINLNNEETKETTEMSSSENMNTTEEKVFSIDSAESTSFTAQMDGETTEGDTYTAEIKQDEAGNTSYSGSLNGDESFEFYLYDERNIFCSEGACFEGPTALAANPIPRDQVAFNDEDVVDYRENATYIGRESCNSGMCDAWEIMSDGYTGTLYINDSNRVDSANWEGTEGSFEINYTYESVVITLPENIQSIPAL